MEGRDPAVLAARPACAAVPKQCETRHIVVTIQQSCDVSDVQGPYSLLVQLQLHSIVVDPASRHILEICLLETMG